ncbi:MAG TPA: hypothetical protein VGY76_01600 [Solirubrobacteraceae bacterium]|nr:hypothetical protein [Solirubrobacteraceae bacterium]
MVVPLAYSGLELEVWRLAEELDEAFHTRAENLGWFEVPLRNLNQACELLRVIDWQRTGPPVEADIETGSWAAILRSGLQNELWTQHNHRNDEENSAELRDEAERAIAAIEGFLAGLPALEAKASERQKRIVRDDDQDTAERAIVWQVLRDDHTEQWSRAELRGEISHVQPKTVTAALYALRDAGAIHLLDDRVWASRCACRLSDLGILGV